MHASLLLAVGLVAYCTNQASAWCIVNGLDSQVVGVRWSNKNGAKSFDKQLDADKDRGPKAPVFCCPWQDNGCADGGLTSTLASKWCVTVYCSKFGNKGTVICFPRGGYLITRPPNDNGDNAITVLSYDDKVHKPTHDLLIVTRCGLDNKQAIHANP